MKKKTKKNNTKNVKKSSKKPAPKAASKNEQKIVPLGSRILIKPFTKDELAPKNNFGIILPDSGKEKSEQGRVVAVGAGEYQDGDLIPVTVKVGDRVVFSRYGYEEINVDGEELFLIKEENILAILK